MSSMVHAGYLTFENILTAGAVEIFFRHRDEFIEEMTPENPDYDYIPHGEDIRDRSEYPTFYRNWIDGIYTSCIKILNHPPAIMSSYGSPNIPGSPPENVPIYDPYFVYESLSEVATLTAAPTDTIDQIIEHFKLGKVPGEQMLATKMAVADWPPNPNIGPQGTNFKAGLESLPGLQQYEKPLGENFIPEFPNEDFPDLNFGTDTDLSLKRKQELLYESIAKSFDDLRTEVISQPALYLTVIANGVSPTGDEKPPSGQRKPGVGLIPIFEKANEILKNNFPKISEEAGNADDAITNKANYEGLIRSLTKPLYLTVIATVFGSDRFGFVGMMASQQPDAVKLLQEESPEYKPEKYEISPPKEASLIVQATSNFVGQIPPGPCPQKDINTHFNGRQVILSAAANIYPRRTLSPIELQIAQVIGWHETRYGRSPLPKTPKGFTTFNWGGVQCGAAVPSGATCMQSEDRTAGQVVYPVKFVAYQSSELGCADMLRHIFLHRPFTAELLQNAAAESDEPGVDSNGVTLFRVAYSLRREKYFESFCPKAKAAYGLQGVAGSLANPDGNGGQRACADEAVAVWVSTQQKWYNEMLAPNCLNEPLQFPIGTIEDAAAWYKYRNGINS